ncbi:MAG: VIT1/CCC1 transporter family protein, partial [Marinicaulis sp.]|nr:VIT1/CCC1 transporter family protein [Marinicaulis sp.]
MALEHEHTSHAIAARLAEPIRPSYLRDWVIGGIDGAVTTSANVAGAGLSSIVVIILGVANLIIDSISMTANSGIKAENDDSRRLRDMKRRHIRLAPEDEREEVLQIFRNKGFSGETLN